MGGNCAAKVNKGGTVMLAGKTMKKISILAGIRATFVILLPLCCSTAFAQTTGTINGQISDPTGAAVPDASITAENVATGLARKAVSNSVGSYLVSSLPPGPYKVTVEHPGFKTYAQSGITVIVGENARVDAALEVGAVTQSVEVSASAVRVDTQSSMVGTTVDNRRVRDMPLNGRNLLALAQLQPGVGLASFRAVTAARNTGPTVVVSGSRSNQNNIRLDGTDMISNWENYGTNLPSPDNIQEFRVLTNTYDAQYGKASGGVLLAVTNSGTNEFHGSLFEYLRNDALNARNFFAGAEKPVLRQNQFGGSIGGPVRLPGYYDGRDRTFFFFGYQGIRIREQTLATNFPPTTQEKQGIFPTAITDPNTGQPFQDNTIPQDRFDPMARNILDEYFQDFVPNLPDGKRVDLLKIPTRTNQFVVRADHAINPSNRLKFRWFRDVGTMGTPSVFPQLGGDSSMLVDTENLTYTTILTAGLLNEASVSQLRVRSAANPTPSKTAKELGGNFNQDIPIPLPPIVSVAGRFSFNAGTYRYEPDETIQVNDMLTWVRGRHSIKAGTQIGILRHTTLSSYNASGSFSFTGAITGNAFADFLIGQPLSFSERSLNADDSRSRNYHFFAEDDFKINAKLTVNLGLRYEVNLPWWQVRGYESTVRPGQQSQVYPTAPLGLVYPGDSGVPRGLVNTDKNNFAPRVGFAWDPTGKGRTAIRGAYGVFYDTIGAIYSSHVVSNAPFLINFSIIPPPSFSDPLDIAHGGTDYFPYVRSPSTAVFPSQPIVLTSINPNLRDGYIQDFNLNIQHQFGETLVLQAGYVGKIGRKLSGLRPDMNQAVSGPGATLANLQERRPINPERFGNIYEQTSDHNSWYHSFQVNLERRFSRGFTAQVAYTFSKSVDDTSSLSWDNPGEIQDSYNYLRGQRGLSTFDQRHLLAVNCIWELPVMKKNPVLGGWQIAGITRYASGLPFSVYSGQDIALVGNTYQRMDLVGNPRLDPNRSHGELVKKYFNTDAFAIPQTGQFGNSGRNILIGPGFSQTDLSLQKSFRLPGERGRFQFRADFFNLFNQVNFTTLGDSGPNVGLTNSKVSRAFGQILSAKDARVVQLALRYDF
jgi:hypothetical protein